MSFGEPSNILLNSKPQSNHTTQQRTKMFRSIRAGLTRPSYLRSTLRRGFVTTTSPTDNKHAVPQRGMSKKGGRDRRGNRITSTSTDEEEEEEEEKGDWCYGTTVSLSKTYIMAGGSCHWWNYVVEFDVDTGEQKSVYIESKNSKEKQDGYYLFIDEDGNRLALELERPGAKGWTILDDPS